MIFYYYAIADAGGNIYPGSFSLTKTGVVTHFILEVEAQNSPNLRYFDEKYIEECWNKHKLNGDHVVYCKVETNENVIITKQ